MLQRLVKILARYCKIYLTLLIDSPFFRVNQFYFLQEIDFQRIFFSLEIERGGTA